MEDDIRSYANIKTETRELAVGNSKVEYLIDLDSGAIKSVHHKTQKSELRIGDSGAAPVRLWIGTAVDPDNREVVVCQAVKQQFSYRVLRGDECVQVEIDFPNLRDMSGNETRVSLNQCIVLDDDVEFLRIRTRLVNNIAGFQITGLFLGLEDLTCPWDAADEVLTVPDGTMGTFHQNPRDKFAGKPLIGCIPPTVPLGLVCGWLDLGDHGSGFGTGYIDRRGMDMIGEARFEPEAASIGWRMFRYQGAWSFMQPINGPYQIYPLNPGEEFTSDDWFLGFHTDGWHATAKFYRKEYERNFDGDFLRWNDLAPAVKNADVVLDIIAAWRVQSGTDGSYDLDKGEVKCRFLEVPERAKKVIDNIGVEPVNTLLVLLGQATHWGIYKLPDYFPVNAEAGGPEDFKEMIRRLRQDIGIAGTHFYAHPAFNHPEADNYVAEADTGWSANLYVNYDHLGRIACTDTDGWWKLWRDRIIPGFVEAGASGIEFDEGFGHHFICDKPGHSHPTSAVGILTAQHRGASRIFRECRKVFGPDGYLECEGGSDIGARYFDLWECGGSGSAEIVRYTHPDKLIAVFPRGPVDYCGAFVLGLPILSLVDALLGESDVIDAARQFAVLRQEIRRLSAPGYPYAFRDDDGLSVSVDALKAKAFSDTRGITVVYYGTETTKATVTVDCGALDHPDLGVQTRSVSVKSLEAGFFVVCS